MPTKGAKPSNDQVSVGKPHRIDFARIASKSPERSALRANPFSKGTDLVCRLPSSALFYRPEAANLGDLMRFRVRLDSGIKIPWVFIDQ
jgi:hypothetical protein